jgi:hypothetical protein
MKTKQQILTEVLGNETYLSAISKVPEGERKMIEEILHGKFLDVIVGMQALADKVQNDPVTRDAFVQVLNERVGVIKTEEPGVAEVITQE